MRRVAVAAAGLLGAAGLGMGGCVALAAGIPGGPVAVGTAPTGTPVVPGRRAVPPGWEVLDQGAAATCTGLPWGVLAAIGEVESDSGRSTLPGVASGANPAGAEGPMQFEPSTFAAHAVVGPGGVSPPSPYDPADAVYTAAALLCADGGGTPPGVYGAVWDYDHSAVYVARVLVLARGLAADPLLGSVPATALAFAAGKLGVPYRWGGTGVGGYDCSGLVQAAYRSAGVTIPRVTQAQFDAGPAVGAGSPLSPGDLVFFGTSAGDVSHVGIYLGGGQMIDAPHTGAVVRVDATPTVVGSRWGGERYLGATSPAE